MDSQFLKIEEPKAENHSLSKPLKLVSLKNKSDFDLVFKDKDFTHTSGAFKAYIYLHSLKKIEYGFIYPKKNIKLAVNRNYAKRSAKEMLRTLKTKEGFKIIFFVGKKIDSFNKDKIKNNFVELKREIESSF
ncbi:ribonuclease P protein component [Gammaproteobacteria bacterium]|nr:ribonuclease P protein component [Gammaproteobacteria bacterium]